MKSRMKVWRRWAKEADESEFRQRLLAALEGRQPAPANEAPVPGEDALGDQLRAERPRPKVAPRPPLPRTSVEVLFRRLTSRQFTPERAVETLTGMVRSIDCETTPDWPVALRVRLTEAGDPVVETSDGEASADAVFIRELGMFEGRSLPPDTRVALFADKAAAPSATPAAPEHVAAPTTKARKTERSYSSRKSADDINAAVKAVVVYMDEHHVEQVEAIKARCEEHHYTFEGLRGACRKREGDGRTRIDRIRQEMVAAEKASAATRAKAAPSLSGREIPAAKSAKSAKSVRRNPRREKF